jgi:hypothetical protein
MGFSSTLKYLRHYCIGWSVDKGEKQTVSQPTCGTMAGGGKTTDRIPFIAQALYHVLKTFIMAYTLHFSKPVNASQVLI